MTGHNTAIKDGEPSPPCQRQGCHRRAQFMYRSKVTGLRVYRPWCRVCRPGAQVDPSTILARPRVYGPIGQQWGDDVKCPFCDRAREPRAGGLRRPTCRHCRGRAVPPPPPPPAPAKSHRKRPLGRKDAPSPRAAGSGAPTFDPFVFHEHGKRMAVSVPTSDQKALYRLFRADAGHYAAATSPTLTRRYPTALISTLWAQWASLQE